MPVYNYYTAIMILYIRLLVADFAKYSVINRLLKTWKSYNKKNRAKINEKR